MTDLTPWGCSNESVSDEEIKKTRIEHRKKFAFLQENERKE